jgi:hypothetical protein
LAESTRVSTRRTSEASAYRGLDIAYATAAKNHAVA